MGICIFLCTNLQGIGRISLQPIEDSRAFIKDEGR